MQYANIVPKVAPATNWVKLCSDMKYFIEQLRQAMASNMRRVYNVIL